MRRAEFEDEAYIAQEEEFDSKEVLLMVTNGSDLVSSESWYFIKVWMNLLEKCGCILLK